MNKCRIFCFPVHLGWALLMVSLLSYAAEGQSGTETGDGSQEEKGWIALFNGTGLEGWTARGNASWTVRDGVLTGTSEEGHGHIYADPVARDLEVRGMFRLSDQGGGGNSGLYFRANPPRDNPDGFPRGYEAQICHSQEAHTGWLWKPGTPTGRASVLLSRDDEWFSLRILAEGDLIRIWVNDQLVMIHRDDEYKKGRFALQCHNPGMTIEAKELYYRNIDPFKPPRGYRSEFCVKLAYKLGTLKIIDTRPDVPEEIEVHRDLVYRVVDSIPMKLDIYRPVNLEKPAPLLVFIHGGSWSKGDKSDYLPYLVDYALKGYVTATLSYRLAGVAKYPAALEDVVAALEWLKIHADEQMIDPERIALIGGSAGGHLAMLAAYAGKPIPGIRAVVNLYGPVDLTTPYARQREECLNFLGKSYQESPGLYMAASPATHISAEDPPTLIFHGTIDSLVPVSQSDSLHVRLTEAGVLNEYHRLKGWPHTMDLSRKVNDYCQHRMDAFFRSFL